MPIIDAYDAIAKGAHEQKRHFSPFGLSDLDRRALSSVSPAAWGRFARPYAGACGEEPRGTAGMGAASAHCRQIGLRFLGTDGSQTPRWRETDSNLYGAFPVKWCFSVYCQFFVGAEGRSSSRRRRSGSRSARNGVKGPKR